MQSYLPDSGIKTNSVGVTGDVIRAMEEHALRSRPAECCGLLSGTGGLITTIHPLRNQAAQPEVRYEAAPEDLFAAMRRIREAAQILIAVYHSHPRTPAYPSPTDVEMAFYPEAFYFIMSLERRFEVRAFRIEEGRIEDVDILVSMLDSRLSEKHHEGGQD